MTWSKSKREKRQIINGIVKSAGRFFSIHKNVFFFFSVQTYITKTKIVTQLLFRQCHPFFKLNIFRFSCFFWYVFVVQCLSRRLSYLSVSFFIIFFSVNCLSEEHYWFSIQQFSKTWNSIQTAFGPKMQCKSCDRNSGSNSNNGKSDTKKNLWKNRINFFFSIKTKIINRDKQPFVGYGK